LTYVAPARAASSAWFGVNTSVTLVLMPLSDRARVAFKPSAVIGTLMTTFSAQPAYSWPSRIMPSASVDTTSALTGPGTMDVISAITCLKSPPSLATTDGLVVTPANTPHECTSRISSILAVSINNFIVQTSSSAHRPFSTRSNISHQRPNRGPSPAAARPGPRNNCSDRAVTRPGSTRQPSSPAAPGS